MNLPTIPRRPGIPLAMQMVAVLICALLAAQAVTLALTVLLPPRPPERWDMAEVANALAGRRAVDRLESKVMSGPPDVSGQGWLVSESSRQALAKRIGRSADEVVLAFYTQLPVGGVAVPSSARSPMASNDGPHGEALAALFVGQAQAQGIPGGPPAGGHPGPGGMPAGGFPGGRMPGGNFPGGGFPGGGPHGGGFPGGAAGSRPSGYPSSTTLPGPARSGPSRPDAGAPHIDAPVGGVGRNAGPANGQGPAPTNSAPPGNGPGAPGGRGGAPNAGSPMAPSLSGALPIISQRNDRGPPNWTPPEVAAPVAIPTPVRDTIVLPPGAAPAAQLSVETPVVAAQPPSQPASTPPRGTVVQGAATPQPIPFRRAASSLFDTASAPFIEGDFVAAARRSDGTWLAVAPTAEPFPNAWQTRVMLWFALSLAIVSPLALLFVRRIVVPLRDFARAAEQLGRDPSATILPLSGPAEIGRAANAFNQMRHRLRAFVDDRTAMVGAISHDLRTPLTRLRFRIEDVPDEQRDGLLKEVGEMEAMISQVIGFIRDASTPGPRRCVDFAEIIADSVADWQLIGADVAIERNAHIPVEADPVGIRRLLDNLLENAVKYGNSARVRVTWADSEAIAEIRDAGPGIPEDEFDRAFEAFYRSETARKSSSSGSGLGLAVCRSIARAHGGEVSFAHKEDGFVARVSVPAVGMPTLRKAA